MTKKISSINRMQFVGVTRTSGAGSGTQTVTVNGKPISVRFLGQVDSDDKACSDGISDGTNNHCVYSEGSVNDMRFHATKSCNLTIAAGGYDFVANNFTDDSFDIVWNALGSAQNVTMKCYVLFE